MKNKGTIIFYFWKLLVLIELHCLTHSALVRCMIPVWQGTKVKSPLVHHSELLAVTSLDKPVLRSFLSQSNPHYNVILKALKKPAESFWLGWLYIYLKRILVQEWMHCHRSNTSLSGLFDQNFSQFFVRGQICWNYTIKLASISQKDGWSVKIFDEQKFERFSFAL